MRSDDTHVSISRLSLSVVKEADRCVIKRSEDNNLLHHSLSSRLLSLQRGEERERGRDRRRSDGVVITRAERRKTVA